MIGSILGILIFTFGCVAALRPLERFPAQLPASSGGRRAAFVSLAPLVHRSVTGAMVMTLGLAGIFRGTVLGTRLMLWAALAALAVAVVSGYKAGRQERAAMLRDVRKYTRIAAFNLAGVAVATVIHAAISLRGRALFVLVACALILVARQVTSVLDGAARELLGLVADADDAAAPATLGHGLPVQTGAR